MKDNNGNKQKDTTIIAQLSAIDLKQLKPPKTTKELFILLIIILGIILIIVYVLPDTLTLLLDTVLGNAILLLILIYLAIYKDYRITIIFIIGWVIISRFMQLIKKQSPPTPIIPIPSIPIKDGFTSTNTNSPTSISAYNQWTDAQIKQFTDLQHTINPSTIFDIDQLQKTTSTEELDYYFANNNWEWSPEVEELYKQNLKYNTYISNLPEDGLRQAKRIYSQGQILQILSQQSKEGQFLINGVIIQDSSSNNLPTRKGIGQFSFQSGEQIRERPVIRCGINPTDPDGALIPQKIMPMSNGNYTSDPTINNISSSSQQQIITDYSTLETEVPGFQFIDGPCNPCVALNNPPDYSCKFQLDIKNTNTSNTNTNYKNPFAFSESGVSSIWSYLWGLK